MNSAFAQANFSPQAEVIALSDGGRFLVRPVRATDKGRFRRAFEALSSLSRYRRFLAHKNGLSDADLRFFTEADGERHFALVALKPRRDGGEGELVGAARYVRLDDDSDTAEIAVAVVDAYQRRGIGKLLLERLRQAAYQRGIRRIRVHLMAENVPVRNLLESLFGDQPLEREGNVISGDIPLFAPESETTRESRAPLFELLRLAAEEAVLPVSLSLMFSRARLAELKRRLT